MGVEGRLKAIAERVRASVAGRRRRSTEMRAGVPVAIQRMGKRVEALPKATPGNLRKLAESPMARRAINTIKDRIACMGWRVQLKAHAVDDGTAEARRLALTRMFEAPNPGDSMRTLLEQVLEDVIVGGFGAVELEEAEGFENFVFTTTGTRDTEDTKDENSCASSDDRTDSLCERMRQSQSGAAGIPGRVPLQLWAVDGATVRINPAWDGKKESVRYAQDPSLGLGAAASEGWNEVTGGQSLVQLRDEDLVYVRANARSHSPFGLGRMEVAFEAVNALLSAGRYAGRLASNSVVQYALWLEKATPAEHDRLIRWWQDEIEGTGRVPLMTCEAKPEVLRFSGGTDAELRLQWQEFLVRVIAAAFDLPPMALGIEHDVNRSTAEQLADEAFRTAVRPTALLLAEHFTRDIIQKKLGWGDLEFVFTELDARDEMDELEMQLKLLSAGVVTVEEVRAMRGLGEQGSKAR